MEVLFFGLVVTAVVVYGVYRLIKSRTNGDGNGVL